ncbi:MAG: hypothetical protein NC203_00505 [Firmicutes bacterium]|nr:hypothetical protein [[Eubacterium] siraeum]MCM1486820.1 hypothetical protein [Bacillota bacterium]
MVIEKKWVVFETRTGLYYAGNDEKDFPTPKPLSSKTRQYCTQRNAKCAIDRISEKTEYYNFVPRYIENQEVEDTEAAKDPDGLTEADNQKGWREVYGFAVPGTDKFAAFKLCLKVTGGVERFGLKKEDGRIYEGANEKVLRSFCEACYDFLLPRVTRQERMKNERN